MTMHTPEDPETDQAADRRRKAEEHLQARENDRGSPRSETDARALVHELQVHQFELEMQNEEIQRARIEAQEALDRYYDLFDFAPVGYFLLEDNGQIREVNLAGAALFGLDRSSASKYRFGQFVATEDRPAFADFLTRVLASDTKQTCELKLLGVKSDMSVLIEGIATRESQSQPMLCRAAVIDLTQQKRVGELTAANARLKATERLLRASEEQFRRAIEDAPIPVIMHAEDGRVLQISRTWTELTGYTLVEVPTVDAWLNRAYGKGADAVRNHVRELFSGKKRSLNVEFPIQTRGGQVRHLSFSASSPGTLADGRRFVVGMAVDITARKQAEEDLRSAKEAAEQANRAKDHFLAALSHELRTPLTPVVLGVSLLQDRTDLAPAVRETLEMVRRNVEMEARLIDDLLDVARIARGTITLNRRPVQLWPIVQRAIEVCTPDIEARGLEFGVDWGASQPYWVEADVGRLQQVFWNLLKNAIKFTPHGGCVSIRCRPNADHVLVEVNDSGIGIVPESLSRIFDAFDQSNRSVSRQFGGLGLGLAISKTLVEMHGGTITVHSDGPGAGATFRVRLPLTTPAPEAADGTAEAASPAAASTPTVRPLRILLVEDHGVTAKMMRVVLAEAGHTVETAGDVATGLKLAGRQSFDLLLSDLGLPDGSGHDLIRELRARGYTFPAIALSGYGQEDDLQRSREAGFAAHLIKPASREAVFEAVAAATAKPSATEVTRSTFAGGKGSRSG